MRAGDVRAGLRWVGSSPLIVRLMAIAAALGLISELAVNQLVLYVGRDSGRRTAGRRHDPTVRHRERDVPVSGALLVTVCVAAVPTLHRFGRELVPDVR